MIWIFHPSIWTVSFPVFQLKPYVSYKVPEIYQAKMTARELFQATYGAEITKGIEEGKVKIRDGQFVGLNKEKGDER